MDDEYEVEVDVIVLPTHIVYLWGVILAPAMFDVCQSPRTRELAHMIVPGLLMEAAHWAGHHYLRQCTHTVGAPWMN